MRQRPCLDHPGYADWIAEISSWGNETLRGPVLDGVPNMTELKRVLYNGWFWVGMLLTLLVRQAWFA